MASLLCHCLHVSTEPTLRDGPTSYHILCFRFIAAVQGEQVCTNTDGTASCSISGICLGTQLTFTSTTSTTQTPALTPTQSATAANASLQAGTVGVVSGPTNTTTQATGSAAVAAGSTSNVQSAPGPTVLPGAAQTTSSSASSTVTATTAPTISLVGLSTIALSVGQAYAACPAPAALSPSSVACERGVAANDTRDGDLTASVSVTCVLQAAGTTSASGAVQIPFPITLGSPAKFSTAGLSACSGLTTTAGKVTLMYTATNSAGLSASVNKTLTISEVCLPGMTSCGDGTCSDGGCNITDHMTLLISCMPWGHP
jgi:hypothetical protein